MAESMSAPPPRLTPPPPSLPGRHGLAVLVAAGGVALFALMDALMKRASLADGVYSVLLARNLIGVAMVAPVWLARGGRRPGRQAMRLHLLRGLLVAAMSWTFFWGLVRLPMAEAIAISFVAPLVALWLAAIHLSERVRPRAIAAALCGLAGVGLIAAFRLGSEGPRGDEAGWGIAAVLLSSLFYAVSLVVQRRQAQVAAPLEIAMSQNLVVSLVLLPLAPWFWQALGNEALVDVTAAAAFASASLVLLAWAYARAEAQVLVLVEYTAFIWSALMGWWWFAEQVTAATLAGVALILFGVWQGTRGRQLEPPAPV